jgi:hypothetical protein
MSIIIYDSLKTKLVTDYSALTLPNELLRITNLLYVAESVNDMATTRYDAFDKTIHKTNTLLKNIETELGSITGCTSCITR